MNSIRLTVNGREREIEVEACKLLVHAVREDLGLTGTHVGCLTGDCGACTVLVDGASVKSCSVLAVQADGAEITTIEGVAGDGGLHPVQQAFWDEFGFQCGYCLPGMLLTARELLDRTPDPDDDAIVQAINGNLCRCTGYGSIVRAIRCAATRMAASGEPAGEAS
ncbi:Carbon monoxide dehydrogenase small chain [Nonomuraea coxensis DSM 45129]|uniref:Carbon monoxide dehydrogenase small chain n=1 Tax=Nonomuraea coxensis DSM 45129 TaxID=1122611 RepID=A0ABX8U8W0_9ACTN|nr:(2Fe-2S)-binding protein [Nonomuraea coxensis]QYC44200.1 Carbon monoxide dehydrogenase small chain [Nonomuraea coxensis DSM 45129]